MNCYADVAPTSPTATYSDALMMMDAEMDVQDYLAPLFDPDIDLTDSIRSPSPGDLWVEQQFEARFRPFVFPLEPLEYDPDPKPFKKPDTTPAVAEAEEAYWGQYWTDDRERPSLFKKVHEYIDPESDRQRVASEKDEISAKTDNELVTGQMSRPNFIGNARCLRSVGRLIEALYQYCVEPLTSAQVWLETLDAMWEIAQTEAKSLSELWSPPKILTSSLSPHFPALNLVYCILWPKEDGNIEQLVDQALGGENREPDSFEDMFAGVCLYHYLFVACALIPIWSQPTLGSSSYQHAQTTSQTRLLSLCKRLTSMKQVLSGYQHRFLRRRLTWAVQQCSPYLSAPGLDLTLGGLSLDNPLSAVDLIAADEPVLQAREKTCRRLDSPVARLGEQLCKIIRLSKQDILTEAEKLSLFGLAREYVDTLRSNFWTAAVCDFCSAMLMIDTPFFLARRSLSRWAAYGVCKWYEKLSVSKAMAAHPRGYLVAYRLRKSALYMGDPLDAQLDDQSFQSAINVKVLPDPLGSLRIGPEIPRGSAREVQTYLARNEIIAFCSSSWDSGPEDPLHLMLHEANHILVWDQHGWRLTRALHAGQRAGKSLLNKLLADKDFEAARNVLAFGDIRGPSGTQVAQMEQLVTALQRLSSMAKEITSRQFLPPHSYLPRRVRYTGLARLSQLLHYICGDTVLQLAQMSEIIAADSYSLAKEAYGAAIQSEAANAAIEASRLADRARLRLLELEELLCRRGSFQGGVSGFLENCLRVERSIRQAWFLSIARKMVLTTPLSAREALEYQQYERHTAESIQTVQHFSRSICMLNSRDLEAFWWQQRTKAALASMFVAQRQYAAVLLALEYDQDDRALPWQDENTRRSWIDLKNQVRARQLDDPVSRSVIPQGGFQFSGAQLSVGSDLRDMAERFAIAKASHERPSSLVLVDWVEDMREDRYHMSVARSGGGITHTDISIQVTPSKLMTWLTHSWGEQRVALDRPEEVSELRNLDPLVLELGHFTAPGEHLIFCPTGLLHQLPLHALWVAYDTPIETRNQVTYTANLFAYDACERRGMTGSSGRISSSEASVAITSVYRPLPGQRVTKGFERNQRGLRAAVTKLAEPAGRRLVWDEDVDRESMALLLQNSKALLYIGHCVLLQPDEGSPPKCHMVLADGEDRGCSAGSKLMAGTFGEDDMLALSIPGSLLVLTACESSFQLISPLDEPLGLPTAALVAGAATVIGTLWPVRIHPAVYFSERLFEWLTDPSTKDADGMKNVAKAMHLAVVDVRNAYRNPRDWAGYVLHGSPRMRDIFAQEGPLTIGAEEERRLLVGANE